MKYIGIIFIFISGFFPSSAQVIHPESSLTYLYKLTPVQALHLKEKREAIPGPDYFKVPYDSFPSQKNYSKTPLPGYYLAVKAKYKNIEHTLIQVSNLETHIQNNGKDLGIRITQKSTGATVRNAKVNLNKTPLVYEEPSASYVLRKKVKKGKLTVEADGETLFLEITGNTNSKETPDKQEKYTGYIAFDKPRYRRGDTVKLKTYILQNGKPLTEALQLRVPKEQYYEWDDKTSIIKTDLAPVTPGAYVYSFVAGDSMQIDRKYVVNFYRKKGKKERNFPRVISSYFSMEDYQLDQTSYSAKTSRAEYAPGDTVTLILSGTDFNGLPLFDASAEISIQTSTIISPSKDSEDFPYMVYMQKLNLDASGETRISFPPSLFSRSGVQYEVTAGFKNSNGELHKESANFQILQQQNSIEVKDQDSILVARLFVKGKESMDTGTVTFLGRDETSISSKHITFPFSFLPPQGSRQCYVQSGKRGKRAYFSESGISADGYRTNDSVYIAVHNPRKIRFYYELSREGKLIAKGTEVSLNYSVKDPGKAVYKLLLTAPWCDNTATSCYTILPKDKTLSVEVVQPKEIYPGEKAEVMVKVTDYDQKPVPDANITLSCINAQFGDKNIPTLPDYNAQPQVHKKEYFIYQSFLSGYHNTEDLNQSWIRKMHLDTISYYKLLYPGNALYTAYTPLKTNDAQFSPFVVSNGAFIKIWFIYVDGKPVYASSTDPLFSNYRNFDRSPWSFLVPEGIHRVLIRTYTNEYLLDQVEFKKGSRLEISFNANNPAPSVQKKKRSSKLSEEEKALMKENLFVFNNVSGSYEGVNYFRQGNNIRALLEHSCALFHPGDSIHYKVYTRTKVKTGAFLFVPGRMYSFNDDSVKSRPWNFKGKRLYSYYGEDNLPGRPALTLADMYSSNLHYGYYYGQRDGPERNGSSDTSKASYLFQYTGKETLASLELYSATSDDAQVLHLNTNNYQYRNNYILHNIRPGTYTAIFRKENGDYFEKEITLLGGRLRFERIVPVAFTPVAKSLPLPVQCSSYSLSYHTAPLSIHGKLDGVSLLSDIPIGVFYKGSRIGVVNTDKAGRFEVEVEEAGIYNLKIEGDTLFQNSFVGGLIISKSYSPEILIHLKYYTKGEGSVLAFNRAWNGKNYLLNQDTLSHSAQSQIEYSPEKTDAPHILDYFNSFAKGEQKWQTISDEPDFRVDGNRITERYRTSHQMFRHRHRAKFYRSSFASSYGSFYKSKKKFRKVTVGWDYNESESGGFAREEKEQDNFSPNFITYDADLRTQVYFCPSDLGTEGDWENGRSDGTRKNTFGIFALSLSDTRSGIGHKQIRKTFDDCAYWKPNLLTDSNGKVSVNVTFPENITRWDGYALAMTANKQSGKGQISTKSYKPLVATLSSPRFLLLGDTSFVVGKIMNYGKDDAKLTTSFLNGGKLLQQKTQTVSKGINEKQLISPTKTDSLQLEYSLQTPSGYEDGEQQSIPVLTIGSEEAKGEFYYLPKDTLFRLPLDTSGKTEITLLGNDLDLLLSKLKTIQDYPYFCNEQIASKLNALLMEKIIFQKQGKVFQHEREITRLIRKLEKAQNDKGAWGWWDDSHTVNVFMTAYITHVLGKAVKAGYTSNAFQKGLSALAFELPGLEGDLMVYTMSVLSESNALPEPGRFLSKVGKNSTISTWSRYMLIHIRQENSLDAGADIIKLMGDKKETALGACYWGVAGTEWFDNSAQLSLMAYRILEKQGGQEKILEGIRKYFLEHSDNNLFRNTYETACILETILPSRLASFSESKEKMALTLQGGLDKTLDHFPYITSFKPATTQLQISKTGKAPVYFALYKRSWNPKPDKKEDLFNIATHFETEGKSTGKLEFGKVTTLIVEVNARKKGDYIMLEIPIPAGCSYQDKRQSSAGNEVHREYFKDKVVIFCEAMPAGTWRYEISLQPRYIGSYSMNPCKAKLMYFPFMYGRTEVKRIKIE